MECEFCLNHEQGDTLYESSDWDSGIGFDYIRNIKYCPLCGRKLVEQTEPFFRNPTEEEMESVHKYIESISIPTGVNVFNLM